MFLPGTRSLAAEPRPQPIYALYTQACIQWENPGSEHRTVPELPKVSVSSGHQNKDHRLGDLNIDTYFRVLGAASST